MNKLIFILILSIILLISIYPISADPHTFIVNEKRIEEDHLIIGHIDYNSGVVDGLKIEEYYINIEDYYNINLGDTVIVEYNGGILFDAKKVTV